MSGISPLDRILIERRRPLSMEVCLGVSLEPLFIFIKEERRIPNLNQFPAKLTHLIACLRCQEKLGEFLQANGLDVLLIEWLANPSKL